MNTENAPSESQTPAAASQLQVLAAPSAVEPCATQTTTNDQSRLVVVEPAFSRRPALESHLSNARTNGDGELETAHSPVVPVPAPKRKTRNGKIARLPKIERDMVCRMLRDAVPHKRIVFALEERDIFVTERNISNFKTRGAYEEWRHEQERLLENQLTQEALVDHLSDSPSELPAVGLQAIATRFSKHLLRQDVQENIEAHPEQFAPLISSLCRLSKEILNLQKYRDLRQSAGNPGFRKEHAKAQDLKEAEATRAVFTAPPPGPDENAYNDVLPPLRQR